MKNLLTTAIFIIVLYPAYSQVPSISIAEDFKTMAGFLGTKQTGYEGIQTYTSNTVKGTKFYFPAWAPGSVTTIHNETLSKGYLFIYDKVNQQLYIKQIDTSDSVNYELSKGTSRFVRPKNTDVIVIADKDQVQSFTLDLENTHTFVNGAVFDPSRKNDFLEVLVQNPSYTLLKFTQTKFVKMDMYDMIKVKNGDFSDEFDDNVSYYVLHNNKLQKVALKDYSIRKAFKDQSQKIDQYLDEQQSNDLNEQQLISLINMLNS